jgi:hypothetical protein
MGSVFILLKEIIFYMDLFFCLRLQTYKNYCNLILLHIPTIVNTF